MANQNETTLVSRAPTGASSSFADGAHVCFTSFDKSNKEARRYVIACRGESFPGFIEYDGVWDRLMKDETNNEWAERLSPSDLKFLAVPEDDHDKACEFYQCVLSILRKGACDRSEVIVSQLPEKLFNNRFGMGFREAFRQNFQKPLTALSAVLADANVRENFNKFSEVQRERTATWCYDHCCIPCSRKTCNRCDMDAGRCCNRVARGDGPLDEEQSGVCCSWCGIRYCCGSRINSCAKCITTLAYVAVIAIALCIVLFLLYLAGAPLFYLAAKAKAALGVVLNWTIFWAGNVIWWLVSYYWTVIKHTSPMPCYQLLGAGDSLCYGDTVGSRPSRLMYHVEKQWLIDHNQPHGLTDEQRYFHDTNFTVMERHCFFYFAEWARDRSGEVYDADKSMMLRYIVQNNDPDTAEYGDGTFCKDIDPRYPVRTLEQICDPVRAKEGFPFGLWCILWNTWWGIPRTTLTYIDGVQRTAKQRAPSLTPTVVSKLPAASRPPIAKAVAGSRRPPAVPVSVSRPYLGPWTLARTHMRAAFDCLMNGTGEDTKRQTMCDMMFHNPEGYRVFFCACHVREWMDKPGAVDCGAVVQQTKLYSEYKTVRNVKRFCNQTEDSAMTSPELQELEAAAALAADALEDTYGNHNTDDGGVNEWSVNDQSVNDQSVAPVTEAMGSTDAFEPDSIY